MAGEPAVDIAPREDLLWADSSVATEAGRALPARCDSRNHDLLSDQLLRALTRFDHRPAHFVTEGEGDSVHLVETDEGILITPFDPDFKEAMEIYAEGAKRYRNAMRELAK